MCLQENVEKQAQFPFQLIKGFPEINMRGFVETTPENDSEEARERA